MMKDQRPRWPDWRVAQLVELRDQGLSYAQAGKVLGCTRNAVSRAVRTYIHGIRDEDARRPPEHQRRHTSLWTEAKLTEPWAAWSARRKAERQQLATHA
jgi:hypothetical protein